MFPEYQDFQAYLAKPTTVPSDNYTKEFAYTEEAYFPTAVEQWDERDVRLPVH